MRDSSILNPQSSIRDQRRWSRLYAAVIINLVVLVVLFYVLTRSFA